MTATMANHGTEVTASTNETPNSQKCEMWRVGLRSRKRGRHNTNPCDNPAKLVVIIHNHEPYVPSCPDCYAAFRRLGNELTRMRCTMCRMEITMHDVRSERL